MSGLPEKIVSLHRAFEGAGLDHAFGGALALAWCTERARGTIDIDVNVFVSPTDAARVTAALPADVRVTSGDLVLLDRDGQVRLWWDETPIDVFLNTTDFHDGVSARCRVEQFAGTEVPFLGCSDLAVFKAFFNRTKDWADLEEMLALDSVDVDRVLGTLVRYLGGDDPRIERLRSLL